jgi:DNA replication and repair protein RecF
MAITELRIEQFRNIREARIHPKSTFNFLYGANGAGKTSVLEALYHLGTGRSFRTSQSNLLIQNAAESFRVFSVLETTSASIPVGVERHKDGRKNIRMNGEKVASLSVLAQQLPLLFLGTESHRFFHEGPKLRRQTLDWGVFHVEHSFHSYWRSCETILKQRNVLIKNRRPYSEIVSWDIELATSAEQLHQLRASYISEFWPIAEALLGKLLNVDDLTLHYERGWANNINLQEALKKNYERDLMIGYTQLGPHRADLQLLYQAFPAQNYLSQGQQKLAAYGLYLAQGLLLEKKTEKKPIYLIDDLASELDVNKQKAVLKVLQDLNAQVFITGTSCQESEFLANTEECQLFHVEHGVIHRK